MKLSTYKIVVYVNSVFSEIYEKILFQYVSVLTTVKIVRYPYGSIKRRCSTEMAVKTLIDTTKTKLYDDYTCMSLLLRLTSPGGGRLTG